MGSPLTPQVFAILSAIIEDKIGIHYGPLERELLADKLAPRLAETGFESYLEYYYYLRYDPASESEIEALIEVLVVGETYFFREADQLRVWRDRILPELLTKVDRVRVWSAACASGEEPISLAILLAERDLLNRVEIVASDVSRRALERARKGEYGSRALRSWRPEPSNPWVSVGPHGAQVSRELVQRIDWRRINLIRRNEVATLGPFDTVICRNVLIYFRDQTIERVVSNLGMTLRPGGRLLVGASESLLRFGTMFEPEELGGAFFYRARP
jgi:chemotaxis protein methyltransferase CheR